MRQPEISSLAPLASKGSRRSMLREGKGGFYRARSMGSGERHAKLAVNNRGAFRRRSGPWPKSSLRSNFRSPMLYVRAHGRSSHTRPGAINHNDKDGGKSLFLRNLLSSREYGPGGILRIKRDRKGSKTNRELTNICHSIANLNNSFWKFFDFLYAKICKVNRYPLYTLRYYFNYRFGKQ